MQPINDSFRNSACIPLDGCAELQQALRDPVLAHAEIVGTYSLNPAVK